LAVDKSVNSRIRKSATRKRWNESYSAAVCELCEACEKLLEREAVVPGCLVPLPLVAAESVMATTQDRIIIAQRIDGKYLE